MLRARRMRVDSTISECSPEASIQTTPPSGRSERSRLMVRGLLENANAVANVGGELELLGLDGSLEPIAQLAEGHRPIDLVSAGRLVCAAGVPRVAVGAAEELPQTRRERFVAVGATKPAGRPEIRQGS